MAVGTPRRAVRWLVLFLRWGVPLLMVIGGVVLVLLGHGHVSDVQDQASGSVFTQIPTDRNSYYSASGVAVMVIAVMYLMIGWFARMNSRDGDERARDEAARDYYARTGRWPGERGPRGTNR